MSAGDAPRKALHSGFKINKGWRGGSALAARRGAKMWVKIDNGLPDHPKVIGLSDAAFRLYVTGICYSSRFLTDGELSSAVLRRLGGAEAAQELVKAGLLAETAGGAQIASYGEYQQSKETVEAKKEANRKRVTRYREKRNAVSNALLTYPDTDIDTDIDTRETNKELPEPYDSGKAIDTLRVRSAKAAVERISDKLGTARANGVNAWSLSRLVEEEWDTLQASNDIGGCIALTSWYVSELQERKLTSQEIARIGQMTKRFGRIALLAIDEAAMKDLTDLVSYAFRIAQNKYTESDKERQK